MYSCSSVEVIGSFDALESRDIHSFDDNSDLLAKRTFASYTV